jgi:pentatricopeptide repeat protein
MPSGLSPQRRLSPSHMSINAPIGCPSLRWLLNAPSAPKASALTSRPTLLQPVLRILLPSRPRCLLQRLPQLLLSCQQPPTRLHRRSLLLLLPFTLTASEDGEVKFSTAALSDTSSVASEDDSKHPAFLREILRAIKKQQHDNSVNLIVQAAPSKLTSEHWALLMNRICHRHFPAEHLCKVVDMMLTSVSAPPLQLYNMVIRALGTRHQISKMEQVFKHLCASSTKPDLFTFNILMDIYGHHKQLDKVKETFAELCKSLKPDHVSFNTIMHAYARTVRFFVVTCVRV